MRAIIAVNNLGYIGLNGAIPWRSRDDMVMFSKLTMGCRLVAGTRTFDSLPELRGRQLLRFTRSMTPLEFHSDDWCIGGRQTYESLCHLFTDLYVSHINDNTLGDTMFPDLRNLPSSCIVHNYNFDVS